MFTVNKYASPGPSKETTHTSYTRSIAGLKYNINGSGRDTYIYNDQGGFGAM
jgi:hypothetical protein